MAIAVYSMIFEFMLRATVQGSAAFFSQTTLGIFVCFGIVSLAVVFLERRLKQGIDLSISYCAIVVFMLAAILLVSVATEDYLALPRCIATVGFLLFWLLAMITYANISALQEGKVLPVFAWGLFAEQAGELMGSSFELFERFSPGTAILGISGKTMASFAVALLLIVATILILSRKDAFARNDRTNPIAPVPSFEGRCSDLAERFGLSKREQDVLLLLAQGRSNPYVKAELLVSESTVNTHVKSIYRKLGIHSRQDLLDIIHADG
ncbi:MAG: helix-turn-helix transcriptional regulator [Coriobacteriaceae bacterium]|nr:helix-turn-helix transcriptional regulator [Coriobacteriaceae bacterium]